MAREYACLNCGERETMLGKKLCESCIAAMHADRYRGDGR